jgi:hypothetical protein
VRVPPTDRELRGVPGTDVMLAGNELDEKPNRPMFSMIDVLAKLRSMSYSAFSLCQLAFRKTL